MPDHRTTPVIVVTGASQGIGAAIARAFARELPGVRLALVARNRTKLKAVAEACMKAGAAVETFPCDVSDEQAVSAMARNVLQRFKAVDVLINNAGSFAVGFLSTMSVSEFDRMISANLRSVFLVSRAFIRPMIRRRQGDIFNMSSVAGLAAFPGAGAYSAAKFGVTGLSQALREEVKGKGVRVCCVYPGATESPSWKGSGVPASRLMPARDVAQAFVSLYRMSRRTVVEEIILRPQLGDLP